jgi:peptidoglycan/LPS O-acetylase OafA/YrhL
MNKRLAFIDTLRGVAVLSVVLQHSLEEIVSNQATGEYYWIFHNAIGYYFNFGRFGVVLFFFVSGFVIPYSFPSSATPVRDFTISRFFRLYPAYWLSIVVVLITAPIVEGKTFPLSQVIVNLSMFQTFVNVPNMRVVYWTLAIELVFYIGCIALFAAGLLNRRLTAFYIVVAASLICIVGPLFIHNRIVWALMEVALNLTAMFVGKVTRDTVIGGRLRWWHVAICATLYCVFAVTLSFKRFGGEYHENFFFGYSIAAAYVSAATVFIVFASFGERLSWRFMAFVGVISYSVYLMAPFVIVWIYYFCGAGRNPAEWLLFVAGVIAISILVSWLTHVAVEKPFISLGHRVRSRSRRAVALEPTLRGQGAE